MIKIERELVSEVETRRWENRAREWCGKLKCEEGGGQVRDRIGSQKGWGAEELRETWVMGKNILPLKIKRSSNFRWRLQSKCQKEQVMVE